MTKWRFVLDILIKFNLQLNTFNILGPEFENAGYPTQEVSRM